MRRISLKILQTFLQKNFGLDSVYYTRMQCLVVRTQSWPDGLNLELSIRGFYVLKNLVGNYVIYRK